MRERAAAGARPASVVAEQFLADGTKVLAVWSWLRVSRVAKLVTVYVPNE